MSGHPLRTKEPPDEPLDEPTNEPTNLWGAEREGATAAGVLGAPVRNRGVVHGAQPAEADHVVVEPVVRGVAAVLGDLVRVERHVAVPTIEQ